VKVDKLNTLKGVKRSNVQPQDDKYVLPNGRTIYLLAEGERSRPGGRARRLVTHLRLTGASTATREGRVLPCTSNASA